MIAHTFLLRSRHRIHRYTMAPFLQTILAITSLLALGNAHNIQMKAHSRECFHETLHKDDKMTVTFQVGDREFGGSGNLDIDFWVRSELALIMRISTYKLDMVLEQQPTPD